MYRLPVRDTLTTRTMLAEPMTTPRVVNNVFSVLAHRPVMAAAQMARSITDMSRSRSWLESAHCLARVFRFRIERKRGVVFVEGCTDGSALLADTSEPRVRVSVRGPIAAARRRCKVDAQEPFGLCQVPIREHKGHTSVVGQAAVGGGHASGLLDDAAESAGVVSRRVVVRDLEIRLDAVW